MNSLYERDLQAGITGKYAKVYDRLLPGSSILEIGCNTGYFSEFLVGRGHQVLGIESDNKSAIIAQEKGLNVIFGDIENTKILLDINQQFDVVLLMDVLEHLREPLNVLKNISYLLKDQGKLIITGPNIAYWSVRKDLLIGRWNYTDTGILDRTHLHFYTASTWVALIEDAGYKNQFILPAESMIPFEGQLLNLGISSRAVELLRNCCTKLFPDIFTVVYILEAIY